MRLKNVRMWFWPILVFVSAYHIYDNEQGKHNENLVTPKNIFVWKDERNGTEVTLSLPTAWAERQVENQDQHVLAIFSKGMTDLALMRRDSDDEDYKMANERHLALLKNDSGFCLMQEPQIASLTNVDCEYFVFQNSIDSTVDGEYKEVIALHVFATIVDSDAVFIMQASTLADVGSQDSEMKNKSKSRELLKVILEAGFTLRKPRWKT